MTRTDWSDHRIVGLFDVIGFKALYDEIGLVEVSLRMRAVRDRLDASFKWEVKAVTFSDTILLYSPRLFPRFLRQRPGQVKELYVTAAVRQMELFQTYAGTLMAFSLDEGLPLRGAVAFGSCVIQPTRGVYVGAPIIDAYTLEQAQDWVGVAIHRTCFPLCRADESGQSPLVRYDIPLKPGHGVDFDLWTIDWPRLSHIAFDTRSALVARVDAERDGPHAHRWENTLKFFEDRYSLLDAPMLKWMTCSVLRETWGPELWPDDRLIAWAEERGVADQLRESEQAPWETGRDEIIQKFVDSRRRPAPEHAGGSDTREEASPRSDRSS